MVRNRTSDVLGDAPSFRDLLLPDDMLRSLSQAGFHRPSPVQQSAIPLARLGADVIIQAKAGTGKTLVFAVAAVERIDLSNAFPQVLVLAPTREVALQAADVVADAAGGKQVGVATFIGGLPTSEDERVLRRKCHIVVGTPGRVLALVQRGALVTSRIRMFVLDEADKLLSQAFESDVREIVRALPPKRQVLALSATYSEEASTQLKAIMHRPHEVLLSGKTTSLVGMQHLYHLLNGSPLERPNAPDPFLAKQSAVCHILATVPFHQAVIFCNGKGAADELADALTATGHSAASLSSAKGQLARIEVLNALRSFQLRVVVCTDVAARGVDLEKVDLVINFDLPADPATLMHRIGRAGRFGTRGKAITLLWGQGELEQLKRALEEIAGGEVSPFQDGAISHNLSTGQDSASTDAAEQVIVNLALPLIKEPTTPGSNNLTATHAAAAANGTAGILHASLWPEEVGRPLPKPVTWPLEMSAVGTPVLASPVLASGSAFEAPTPARGTEAQFSSGTSDVGAREPQHTLLPTPRIPPGAVQHTHFADVVKSAQLDLERSDDSTSAACALLKAAFQWPPAPEPLVSPASEGSDVPVGAQNPQQSHRRPLGSTQVTSYSRQVAEGVGQWGVSTATLEEEAATLEAWAEGDGAEEMEGLEHDEVANEEAWREYWLQYYDYYGHFPGGSPHDLNGPVTPAAGAAGRPHGGEYDEGQEGEGAMTPWGPVQQDEGAYVRVSVRLLQRYQELEAQAGRQPSPGS